MERAEAEAICEQGKGVVVAVLLRMDEQIQRLEKRVARQDERITQLERRLKRSSCNSSQPPSADPPGTPPRRGKDPSGRKPGGQSGHEGKGRPLLPAWAVDEVVEHWPARCGCGHVFAEGELVGDGDPARHQGEELPPVHVVVTEHRCQRVRCPGCGRRPRGQLSADVAASAFGARFDAAVAVLSVRNRISRRDVVEFCEQLFGARISTGTVDAILTRVADSLEEPYDDLLARVRAAGALNMDETGWRAAGERRALWGRVSPAATPSYALAPTATKTAPRSCSATQARSSPRIAGGPTATARPPPRSPAAGCRGRRLPFSTGASRRGRVVVRPRLPQRSRCRHAALLPFGRRNTATMRRLCGAFGRQPPVASTDATPTSVCDDRRVRPTVVIVDDHAEFRAAARALLEADGFDVVGEAGDAAEALAVAARLLPQVVLLDIQLPDRDGFAVAEELVGGPLVVLTSSHEAAAYGRRLESAPIRGFIAKRELSGEALAALMP